MGNDGGSIPKRRELVKEAARDANTTQAKATLKESQSFSWTTDPLTNHPLQPPIVSDCSGKLYNKDAILEYLLQCADVTTPSDARKEDADKLLHGRVGSLKDVVQVVFEEDPEIKLSWICPVTNKPLGPAVKAAYIVPCGHAFAAVALKELNEDKCLQCGRGFQASDVIPILPTDEAQIKQLESRMADLIAKGLTHSLAKATMGNKKRKRNGEANNSSTGHAKQKPKLTAIRDPSIANLTAKVLQEQDKRNEKRDTDPNTNLRGLFSSNDQSIQKSSHKNDFMTRGITLPQGSSKD